MGSIVLVRIRSPSVSCEVSAGGVLFNNIHIFAHWFVPGISSSPCSWFRAQGGILLTLLAAVTVPFRYSRWLPD